MLKAALLVGIGSFIGGTARYMVAMQFLKWGHMPFPYATFVINITGSLLIGVFFGLSERINVMNHEWRLLLTTGLCGGFTTFSAFAYENLRLLQTSNYLLSAIYVAGSVVLCVAATFAGLSLTKML